jgi:hypothetical protein
MAFLARMRCWPVPESAALSVLFAVNLPLLRAGLSPDLDLALPHNAAGLGNDAYDIAAQARAAWGAAVCWDPSGTDQFAVRRLAEVRAI